MPRFHNLLSIPSALGGPLSRGSIMRAHGAYGGGGPALFMLAGQSNMVGFTTFDGGTEHPDNTVQWSQSNTETATTIPLEHYGTTPGDMGLDIEFARSYRAANPSQKIVLIPVAKGSTGYGQNNWNKGDPEYETAVARTNAAIAHYGVGLSGILWHQGEADANSTNLYTEAQYETALTQMIADMRADITGAASVPFLIGAIGYHLDPGGWPNARDIIQAQKDVAAAVSNAPYVPTYDLTPGTDGIHYDSFSTRILGERFYKALAGEEITFPSGYIPDGDFNHGGNGWILSSNWTISGGVAVCDGLQGANTQLNSEETGEIVLGQSYTVEIVVDSISGGTLTGVSHTGTLGLQIGTISAPGTYTGTFTAGENGRNIRILAGAGCACTISRVSLVDA